MGQPVCCARHQQTGLWLQVQYSQRNLPNNSQRKYIQTLHIPKGFAGEYELTPSFPMELKDVQMLAVSPSGVCSSFAFPTCLTPIAHSTFIHNQLQSRACTAVQQPKPCVVVEVLLCYRTSALMHTKPCLKDTTYIKMQTRIKFLHYCWQASVHWWCVEAVKGIAVYWRSG